MTKTELHQLLIEKIQSNSQARVGRDLGYSASAVNQILHGKYKGDNEAFYQAVLETYGGTEVYCPVWGQIALKECVKNQKKPYGGQNSKAVELYKACRDCENNTTNRR